jgi:hypothetical protein
VPSAVLPLLIVTTRFWLPPQLLSPLLDDTRAVFVTCSAISTLGDVAVGATFKLSKLTLSPVVVAIVVAPRYPLATYGAVPPAGVTLP